MDIMPVCLLDRYYSDLHPVTLTANKHLFKTTVTDILVGIDNNVEDNAASVKGMGDCFVQSCRFSRVQVQLSLFRQ